MNEELNEQLLEHARAEGKQVLPLCPFAKVEFDKNPDYQDVLKI